MISRSFIAGVRKACVCNDLDLQAFIAGILTQTCLMSLLDTCGNTCSSWWKTSLSSLSQCNFKIYSTKQSFHRSRNMQLLQKCKTLFLGCTIWLQFEMSCMALLRTRSHGAILCECDCDSLMRFCKTVTMVWLQFISFVWIAHCNCTEWVLNTFMCNVTHTDVTVIQVGNG